MASPFRPEHDADLLAHHAVTDPRERGRLLAELAAQGEVLAIYPHGTPQAFVVTRLCGFDERTQRLDLELAADATQQQLLAQAGRATAVALLARVKLQFELVHLQVDRAAGRLHAGAPAAVVRLQRRDAFRVVPPADARARLHVGTDAATGEPVPVTVLDLSATGVAFHFAQVPVPLPQPGAVYPGCRLELPATLPIRCELAVRTVDPMADADGAPQVRLGCAWQGLDSPSARAVQVYVNAAQTRGRRLRPGR